MKWNDAIVKKGARKLLFLFVPESYYCCRRLAFRQTFLVAEGAERVERGRGAFENAFNLALSGYVFNLTAAEVIT